MVYESFRAVLQEILDVQGFIVGAAGREYRIGDRVPEISNMLGHRLPGDMIVVGYSNAKEMAAQCERFDMAHDIPNWACFYYRVCAE